jgi:hypothetical protein
MVKEISSNTFYDMTLLELDIVLTKLEIFDLENGLTLEQQDKLLELLSKGVNIVKGGLKNAS